MKPMLDHLPLIQPVTSMEQVERLTAAMKTDPPHVAPTLPTHIMYKRGEPVGYLSDCRTPVLNFWSHSKTNQARDTFFLANFGEHLAVEKGHRILFVPCAEESPLYQFMPSLGYEPMWRTVIWRKRFQT